MEYKEREQIKKEIRQEIKKENRKKLFIVLGILCVIVIVASVFIGLDKLKTQNRLNEAKTNQEQQEQEQNSNKKYFESHEDMLNYLEQYKTDKVEITTDNWKEYITTEDKTEEKKDQFGELKSIIKCSFMKIKDNYCGYAVLRFEAVNSNEYFVGGLKGGNTTTTLWGGNNSLNIMNTMSNLNISKKRSEDGNIEIYDSIFTIEDLKCTKAKGYIYTINIPEELWEIDERGKQYISWGGFERVYKDNIIKELSYKDYKNNEEQ